MVKTLEEINREFLNELSVIKADKERDAFNIGSCSREVLSILTILL